MEVLGCHLLLELKDCNSELLNDLSYIRKAMIETAQDVGATIVGESFHHFSPQGVTGILAIAESHISIHTWPEINYAAVDIFVCGSCDPYQAIAVFERTFASARITVSEHRRGIISK